MRQARFRIGHRRAPLRSPGRPPADEASLKTGTWLGIKPFEPTPEWSDGYLKDVRETEPLYRREGLVHPGQILRAMNWALSHNVVLGPWIHVGSTVQNLAVAPIGKPLTARAIVTGNYDRKGHRFVEVDGLDPVGRNAGGARRPHGHLPAAAGCGRLGARRPTRCNPGNERFSNPRGQAGRQHPVNLGRHWIFALR